MKRYLAYILTAVIVFSCFSSSIAYAQDDDNTRLQSGLMTSSINSDYEKYIADHSGEVTNESVKVDINSKLEINGTISFDIDVPVKGLYSIGMSYKNYDSKNENLSFGLKVDGEYPYQAAKDFELHKMWRDKGEIRIDDIGNEFASEQVIYEDYFFNEVIDLALIDGHKYKLYLTEGKHNITLLEPNVAFDIAYFMLVATKETKAYEAPQNKEEYYKGEPIVIEGEDAIIKSGYFLAPKADTSTTHVTPHDPTKNKVNYIGGGNWSGIGDTIIWETPEVKAGYYKIDFSFSQSTIVGGKTYRAITIDDVSPFAEAEGIGFGFDNGWQNQTFADEDGNPYLFYLSEGKHQIALQVVAGNIAEVRLGLKKALDLIGDLYLEIFKITGETVDIYRDYDLFTQIPEMEEMLITIREELTKCGNKLLEVTGQTSGSNYSVIQNMVVVVNQMLKNKFEAHRLKDTYYSNYGSVSAVLQELSSMPLSLDKIALSAPDEEKPFEKSNVFEKAVFSVRRFFTTFVREYNAVSNTDTDKSITVWINWGLDQAQVLNSLIDNTFTPKTGISVDLQLVNATLVQGVQSGKGPDCFLQHARYEPVNLAMRGVLYDLTQFEDCEEVLNRFQKGAETPYRYKNGLYALPDKQTFYMMFYRKDILDSYGIGIPETWEQFKEASKLLMRNNLAVWMPNTPATGSEQIHAGVGSANIFPSLLLQNGIPLYKDNGKSTNLLSSDSMEVFKEWTDYYRKQKFNLTMNTYNRFRTGTAPIVISTYDFYTTLKVAAFEIDGLWGMTRIPGTVKEDGTISHTTSGAGSGCGILKASKNPEYAWEFLKWWTDAETQYEYCNGVEAVIGPSGRILSSNIEAIKMYAWDNGVLDDILDAWQYVEEIPEYPGSYYVTRSIYQAFWNVVSANKSTKDMLIKFGTEANEEIARKWEQYENRKY